MIAEQASYKQWIAESFRRMVYHGAKVRNHLPPEFHYGMADFVEGIRPSWQTRACVILGFRLAAKTWLAARQYVKWRWLRNPNMQVIVHSSNDGMAKRFVQAIKEEMKLDPIMEELRPAHSTSDFEFNIQGITPEQGTSIAAAGIKTSMTGSRADLYIFDDPEPEVEPESLRSRILAAFGEAGDILHSPDRQARHFGLDHVPGPETTQLLVLGQPHCPMTAYLPRPEDFEDDAEGHPLIDARFLKIPVIDPYTKEWTWPDMMNKKYYHHLHKRPMTPTEVKRSMPTSRWELQYMINTEYMAEAGPVLRLKEIEVKFAKPSQCVMFVDPADSESGCEWGISIGGLHDGKIHICHLGGLWGEAFDFLSEDGEVTAESLGESTWRKVFGIAEEFGVRQVYLEKNLKAASSSCRRYCRRAGVRCVVTEYSATRRKQVRIPEALEQPVNNRMISANPEVLRDTENRRQMLKLRWDSLPKPNDRIDAFADLVMHFIEEPHLYSHGRRQVAKINRAAVFKRVCNQMNPFQRVRSMTK